MNIGTEIGAFVGDFLAIAVPFWAFDGQADRCKTTKGRVIWDGIGVAFLALELVAITRPYFPGNGIGPGHLLGLAACVYMAATKRKGFIV